MISIHSAQKVNAFSFLLKIIAVGYHFFNRIHRLFFFETLAEALLYHLIKKRRKPEFPEIHRTSITQKASVSTSGRKTRLDVAPAPAPTSHPTPRTPHPI
jgi:hypothetical protein